jgi:hypothetical protein
MGDLLSRAPEEITFFPRTRETSQDNSLNDAITRVSPASARCQPVADATIISSGKRPKALRAKSGKDTSFHFAKPWECVRVLAPLLLLLEIPGPFDA